MTDKAMGPGEVRRIRIPAFRCCCARCGHTWTAYTVPVSCASCKSRSWRTAAGSVPMGRPPVRKAS